MKVLRYGQFLGDAEVRPLHEANQNQKKRKKVTNRPKIAVKFSGFAHFRVVVSVHEAYFSPKIVQIDLFKFLCGIRVMMLLIK